jgi:MFS family permease
VARRLPRLVWRHPALRAYFFANALWETALSALKAFIILYLTIGLKFHLRTASLIVGGVALVILIGAGGSGKLGDKFGRIRIVSIALVGYGAGYLVPVFTTAHGALTGFYSISRGVGIVAGPVIAGALIWVTRNGPFKTSHGFQAMWIVCSAATFGSLFFLRRMQAAVEDREALERA